MMLQVSHYIIFTLVNLDEEGRPMADLTNQQQLPHQPPPAGLAPLFSKALPEQNSGLLARKHMRYGMY